MEGFPILQDLAINNKTEEGYHKKGISRPVLYLNTDIKAPIALIIYC